MRQKHERILWHDGSILYFDRGLSDAMYELLKIKRIYTSKFVFFTYKSYFKNCKCYMDETQNHYAKERSLTQKSHVLYDYIYVKYSE